MDMASGGSTRKTFLFCTEPSRYICEPRTAASRGFRFKFIKIEFKDMRCTQNTSLSEYFPQLYYTESYIYYCIAVLPGGFTRANRKIIIIFILYTRGPGRFPSSSRPFLTALLSTLFLPFVYPSKRG